MDFADPSSTALEGISRFEEFLKKMGMPSNFAEIGAKEEDIPRMVKNIGVSDTVSIGGFTPLFAKDVESIYRLAL